MAGVASSGCVIIPRDNNKVMMALIVLNFLILIQNYEVKVINKITDLLVLDLILMQDNYCFFLLSI